jgi:hypothetical protein
MHRRVSALVLTTIFSASGCYAGPCLGLIDKMQARIDAGLASTAQTGKFGKETTAATLSHQPTPASIAAAEARLGEGAKYRRAEAHLRLARVRDRAGNLTGCRSALRQVNRDLR